MPDAQTTPHIACLTALYPAVSHTFILREVEALRQHGINVTTCALRQNRADPPLDQAGQAASATTFYALKAARNPATLARAVIAGLKTPKRYLAALWLALKTPQPGIRGLLYQLLYVAEATVLAQHLRAQKVTHLHAHFAGSSANVAMLTSAIAGIPFSYTLHGPTKSFEPLRWQLTEKTARARFVACISHFSRSQAMFYADPDHWDKLKIVHAGVFPERYPPPNDPGPSGAGPHFFCVGPLTPIHGVEPLLNAFGEARKTRPDLRLSIVGDGRARRDLEHLAAPMGDAVQFLGAQTPAKVTEIMATADAFILPGFAEGLPAALIEAMACAKPVITTRLSGITELVEDGVSGYLVHANDDVGLAEMIGKISDDPDRGKPMGRAGRAKVVAGFDTRHEAARIAALVLGQGGSDPRPDPLYSEVSDACVG